MGRKKTPLEYRPIVKHGCPTEKTFKGGKDVWPIKHTDGTKEFRCVGNSSIHFAEKILARDNAAFGPMCRYCGIRLATVADHIVPWVLVGDYQNAANVAACCKKCNDDFNSEEFIGLKTREKVAQLLAENWELGKKA